MIEAYYNFKKSPFSKNIDPQDIFISEAIAESNGRLDYIKQKRGIMLLTGEPGTGKSLIIRAFLNSLNQNIYKYFYIPLSTVSVIDFYRHLCQSINGQLFHRKAQLFSAIQDGIKNYVENLKKVPLIIFDEAHFLKNENFYELQIIANFDIDSVDPAVIILVGQPHLRQRLMSPIHRAFNQRISMKFNIPAFSKQESDAYIQHHLVLAGNTGPLFEPNALTAIYQASNGIARLINAIALTSLQIGASDKKNSITEEEVYRAVKELQ